MEIKLGSNLVSPPSESAWPTWGLYKLGIPVSQAFVVIQDVHWLESYPTGPLLEASHNGVAIHPPMAPVPLGARQLTTEKGDRLNLTFNACF